MVCTRKKDYGEPPPPKQRRPRATQQDAITKPDAAAAVGDANQDESKTSKSHTDQQGPYTEFPSFSKLPCELCLMIWEESMTPRLVAVGPKAIGGRRLIQHIRSMLPSQLSVNSESRHAALDHYKMRFTISITIDKARFDHNCWRFKSEVTRHQARVVMSPDDTLGLLGWEKLVLWSSCTFQVENANGISPWDSESKPMAFRAQPDVKKVAFLGLDLAWNARIVHDLNSTVSWNLDSILHKKSTRPRKLYSLWDPWYSDSEAAYSKDHVLIHSRNYNGSLQEWGARLLCRASREDIPDWRGAPDILAFELGKEPEEVPRPRTFVVNEWEDPEGYYVMREWSRRRYDPAPQGF
ncbi:hypothetical protein F5883DRAFT_650873 [Diaporthe sp. PMI_573]|nr:hypothetical protein F5883DRAFT_650873 [Diaporthaceae sp. PMI_573]